MISCLNFTFLTPAVESSWKAKFVGGPTVCGLEKHIQEQCRQGKLYASYCQIIQSSGMGKSRLVDEFARTHFLIPVNLRQEFQKGHEGHGQYRVSGFPPPDIAARNFLISANEGSGQGTAQDELENKSFP